MTSLAGYDQASDSVIRNDLAAAAGSIHLSVTIGVICVQTCVCWRNGLTFFVVITMHAKHHVDSI